MGNKNGVTLILTLWVLVVLSLLALCFTYRAHIQSQLVSFFLKEERVFFLTQEGINRAIKEISKDSNSFDALNENWCLPIIVAKKDEKIFALIRDEESKININTTSLAVLKKLFATDEKIIQEIIKRRPFDTKDEILNIEGITAEDYYGSKYRKGIRDLITVWGDGRININTVSKEVLELIPDIRQGIKESIISKQKDMPFAKIEDLKDISGINLEEYSKLKNLSKVSSSIFEIFSKGTLTDIEKKIVVIVKKEKETITILSWQEK